MLIRLLLVSCLILSLNGYCAGPKKVATYDRDLWPVEIENKAQFNQASLFENIMFASAIRELPASLDQKYLQDFTRLKKVNLASANQWLIKTQNRIAKNIALAQCVKNCAEYTWQSVSTIIDRELNQLPTHYQPWKTAAHAFYKTYLYEQMRLAALFPRITSEIDTLNSDEHTGFEWQDGEFLLTFDDGPTKEGHNTDQLITWLKDSDINGVFFALGKRLETRAKKQGDESVMTLYKGQCLASHGYKHDSHAKGDKWSSSINKTRTLVNIYQPENKTVAFRPPYGQRSLALVKELKDQGDDLMLWNIDSQDWNRKLNGEQIAHRMEALMLLWRRGTLLFHDIHPKALVALKRLHRLMLAKESNWLNCQQALLRI